MARPATITEPVPPTEVRVDAAITAWTPRVRTPGDRARRFREQLGLPTDRPIVMTGHQPVLWHAGILAKYLAAHAVAAAHGAALAWCVPDQDAVDPGLTRRPTARDGSDGPGRWTDAPVRLLRDDGLPAGLAAASMPASAVADANPDEFGTLASELRDARDEPSAARQFWTAHARVLTDRLGLPPAPTVYASEVARTDLFAQIIEQMTTDPAGCVAAYNAAARAHPDGGVRALATVPAGGDPDRIELPLWRLQPGRPRAAMYAADLADIPPDQLAPRGLLFTGMLRLAACDLFIHGAGGGVYDAVTEDWLNAWLDRDNTLAPAGVVTATLRLPLGVPEVTRADLHRARWRAHHARHTPGDLDATDAQRAKDDLVAAIARAEPARRAELFAELHGVLARVRTERADRLEELDAEAAAVADALADAALARDRTWPWVLHDDAALAALRAEIVRMATPAETKA